jgi:ABC-type nitrate/sulfonate/bicarbonate transport system substrate-binding protein
MINKMGLKARRLLVCALVLAFAVTAAGCGGQSSDSGSEGTKDITFVLDWTPNTNHTGLYVAMDKGYFEEAGINVEVVQPPEDGATSLVGAGKAQFGVDFQDYLAPALVGDAALPVTAVGAVVQHNTSGIISLKEKGIESPKDMEGHTYATWDLPVEQATLKQVIEDDGGDFAKMKMIPNNITDEPAALEAKQTDAVWIFYGWSGVNAEVQGFDFDYFAFADIDF